MEIDSLVERAHQAARALRGKVRRTPLEFSPWLSEVAGRAVYLKLENHQRTGSFKLRGATYRALTAKQAGQRRLITASTGNHGLALSEAGSELAMQVVVYAPRSVDAQKAEAMRGSGAELVLVGEDCVDAENAAREHAERHGCPYVSPYNDEDVIAGQGTVGVEIAEDLPDVARVYVALGGGGLFSGVGAVLRRNADSRRSEIELVACSPRASAVMIASLQCGRILELESQPTLSDGTAGGVEAGSITFDLCRQLVDRCCLVEEEQIASALRDVVARHHTLIEGAAAVPVAALLEDAPKQRSESGDGPVVVVLCGANVSLQTLREVLA